MGDIKVRDYVRTTYGEIFQITGMKKYKETIIYQTDTYQVVSEGILETELDGYSKKIKDLIRSGDLVIFKISVGTYFGIAKNYKDPRSNLEKILVKGYSIDQIEVKKIITKEQLKMTGYEVN